MAFVSKKIIKGKKQYYLEESLRLPDKKLKKISMYLKGYNPKKKYNLEEYKKKLEEKIKEEFISAKINMYETNNIFTKEVQENIEEMNRGYKKIIKKLTQNQKKDVLDRFTVNFTYESNAIEGNSLTLKDVTFILQEGKIVQGKDLREVYETVNTRKAWEWIFYNKPSLTQKTILKLHELIVENTGVTKGYKKIPNFLLGRNFKTTSPENGQEEMNKILEWYHATNNIHPLQRATIFHGKFEKIHPFEDGNGRVGRLLINMMLLKQGYPPLIIRKTQRIQYFHALEAFDNGHYDNLYRFMLKKYKDTYKKFFKILSKYCCFIW